MRKQPRAHITLDPAIVSLQPIKKAAPIPRIVVDVPAAASGAAAAAPTKSVVVKSAPTKDTIRQAAALSEAEAADVLALAPRLPRSTRETIDRAEALARVRTVLPALTVRLTIGTYSTIGNADLSGGFVLAEISSFNVNFEPRGDDGFGLLHVKAGYTARSVSRRDCVVEDRALGVATSFALRRAARAARDAQAAIDAAVAASHVTPLSVVTPARAAAPVPATVPVKAPVVEDDGEASDDGVVVQPVRVSAAATSSASQLAAVAASESTPPQRRTAHASPPVLATKKGTKPSASSTVSPPTPVTPSGEQRSLRRRARQ